MSLAKVNVSTPGKIYDSGDLPDKEASELVKLAMWASEPVPFDPMELALHEAYQKTVLKMNVRITTWFMNIHCSGCCYPIDNPKKT